MNLRRKMSSSGQADGSILDTLVIKREKRQKLYGTPTLLGYFSIDKEKEFSEDKTRLKYLSLPPIRENLRYNLNKDCEKYVSCDHTKFSLTGFLTWILNNRRYLYLKKSRVSKRQRIDIDFVLTRKDIVTVCQSPYNSKKSVPWMIQATKFGGTIYMLKVATQEEISEVDKRSSEDEMNIKSGNKFVKYITSDTKGGEPNTDSPVNEWEHFFVVAKKEFDGHSLLYTAEVDAADYTERDFPEDSPEQYVEIKVVHEEKRDEINFCKFKLCKWYLQSHVTGIPKIIYGLRNDKYIVDQIETFYTKNLPKMAKRHWDPNVCFNFLSEFLKFVKDWVTDDKQDVVYEFLCTKERKIECRKKNCSENQILPKEFISSFQQDRGEAGTSGTSLSGSNQI